MNKKWECYQTDEEKVKKMAKEYNISPLIATILVNKNLEEKKDIDKFLNPTRNDFYDPYLMPDMEIAINRIIEAIETNGSVAVEESNEVSIKTNSDNIVVI